MRLPRVHNDATMSSVNCHRSLAAPRTDAIARVGGVLLVLAAPVRLHIVQALSRGECSATGPVKSSRLPRSTVSPHLAVLRAARLVRDDRHG